MVLKISLGGFLWPAMTSAQKLRKLAAVAVAITLLALALVALFWPQLIAGRFSPATHVAPDISLIAATSVVRALAAPLFLMGLVALLANYAAPGSRKLLDWSFAVGAALAFVSLQLVLRNWTVDDAAITFAYSENLVRGYGLVLHLNHRHEEAYSSTLWMLMLALARWIGFQIDVTAKVLGAACGATCVLIAMLACAKIQLKNPNNFALLAAAIVCLGAPFVIWSSSGLEHGLQALLLLTVATLPLFVRSTIWATAVCLGALILLRPETPLIVVATIVAYAAEDLAKGRATLVRLWPLVAVPMVVGAALLGFRWSYFGVLYPNPYYAKAADATFISSINILGGSWRYIIDWLSSAGTYLLLPIILLGFSWRRELAVRLAAALILAQFAFVLFVHGDWMREFRFISPVLPLLAVVVVAALNNLGLRFSAVRLKVAIAIMAVFLGVGTVSALQNFRAAPTTPTSVVAAIGKEFVKLAQRLGIKHPTLADHDAGGTSWAANIDLIDLGGLGDRAIAQHMRDAKFMRHYLFVERQPTFIFSSASVFAAGYTHFDRMPEFSEQYVRLEFPDLQFMKADLCYIRRDLVHEAPGISFVENNGQIVAVIVKNDDK